MQSILPRWTFPVGISFSFQQHKSKEGALNFERENVIILSDDIRKLQNTVIKKETDSDAL